MHRHRPVDLAGAALVPEREQQVRDLAPAVVVERIDGQHVVVRGERRRELPGARQRPGLGLEVAQLDRHCADVIRSVKCDPVPWRRCSLPVDALGFELVGRSTEGRPIRGRRFGGPGPALLVFGGIHGDEPASVEALIELRRARRRAFAAAVPLWLLPAVNPDGVARGTEELGARRRPQSQLPGPLVRDRHAPGYFPGPAPLSEPETRVIADLDRRVSRRRGVRRGPRAVRVRQLRRPRRGLGGGGRRRVRLAGAGGHRLPDPRLAGELAGHRSGPSGPDAGAPAGPAEPIPRPGGSGPGRIDTRGARFKRGKLLDRRPWVVFPGFLFKPAPSDPRIWELLVPAQTPNRDPRL